MKIQVLLCNCLLWLTLTGLVVPASLRAGQITRETGQLILGLADGWDASHVTLSFYERNKFGKWKKIHTWKGRLGKNGLAWGLGLHDIPAGAALKREGDGRTPAGMFDISQGAYGFAPSIKKKSALPYRQVTSRCCWYEDPASPYYNSFRLLDHEPATEEEKKAQMRIDDPAHALKLFIGHNAGPPPQARPGFGSSIFFHIWRENGGKASFGCTTMAEKDLAWMISNVDPKKNPRYVVLPTEVYNQVRSLWQLP